MFKKIIAIILIPSICNASLPPTSVKGQSDASAKTKFQFQTPHNQSTDLGGVKTLIETGNNNILPDPGFESSVSGWTASGGATATSNSTAKGTGALGYDWDSNSASQTLQSSSVTIPAGLQGKNGIASCQIKTVSGTATHTIGLWDGSTLSNTQTIENSTTSFIETKINFVFPSSGTAAIRLTSVNANEPEVYIDDCKLLLADNIGTVAQAILVDAVTVTGCSAAWTTSSTSYASFSTKTGCTYTSAKGVASAPSTNIPAFKFASLPAGDYRIEYEGQLMANGATTDASYYQFSDGTNTAREQSVVVTGGAYTGVPGMSQTISYSSPQANVTLEIKSKVSVGTLTSSVLGTTGTPGVFKLWYFPSSSQQAVSSAQADYDWTDSGLTTSSFTGFGTVSGIECKDSRSGPNLLMRCKFTSGTSTAVEARVALPRGLVSADTTKIPSIQISGIAAKTVGDAGQFNTLIEPSTSYVTFGVQSASTGGLNKFNGNGLAASTNNFGFTATIPIQGWSSNQRAPTLVGSVTSNSTGAERIERAKITLSGGTPSITTQSGTWITSLTDNGVGDISINYSSGTFSEAPVCVCTTVWPGAATGGICNINTNSTTTTQFKTANDAGTATDYSFYIHCMGPR